jgi:copper chaperone NosL
MGAAPSWEEPGATNWIDARKAFFVIESRRRGGMETDEAVPFGDRAAADAFAAENAGRVVSFDQIPKDYVLGGDAPEQSGYSPAETRTH